MGEQREKLTVRVHLDSLRERERDYNGGVSDTAPREMTTRKLFSQSGGKVHQLNQKKKTKKTPKAHPEFVKCT